jgi:multiple sugar transport system ATP-binding protein
MANVMIDRVCKAYGPLEVLHGVSADIRDGEFVVLVAHAAAKDRRCCG